MKAAPDDLRVVELRRYAMRPGLRNELINLFEREFIESQEACGMLPVGHYRDLDNTDSYVWFRAFPDMKRRREALEEFYLRSPAWANNRAAANATMVDSDNVLLLRPIAPDRSFDLSELYRPPQGFAASHASFVGVAIFMLDARLSDAARAAVEKDVLPAIERLSHRVGCFETEESKNDVPRLPVREGEYALVVTAIVPEIAALRTWIETLAQPGLPAELRIQVISCEYLRLEPAPRSLFR